jgi:aminoglycoside phosphotransferase (APT) family kinase protein
LVILDAELVIPYLVERRVMGGATDASAEQLAGGYINQVFRVTGPAGELVVKQALEQSRRTILQADIARAHAEVAAMRAVQRYLDNHAPTPVVLDEDRENFVCVMTAAPRDARLYHDELLAGRTHPTAARALGVYAAELHGRTRGDAGAAKEFASNPGFKLRDQSIRSAGAAHPDLKGRIEALLDQNLTLREALVDYDITPKNVLVHSRGITKLDFECAQFGDPAFDVGIVLGHFMLYALARPGWAGPILRAGKAFEEGYASVLGPVSGDFARRGAEYAAVMILGRVAGDLVLDFCTDSITETVAVARRILDDPPDDPDTLLALAAPPAAPVAAAG